jgi:hypothetical protein
LGERLLCKQEVIGSIPFTSTTIGSTTIALRAPVVHDIRRRRENSRCGATRGGELFEG